MRILHTVEFYYPSMGGAQEAVRHLSERMVQKGHDVTVATSYLEDREDFIHNGVKIKQFKASGNQALGLKGDVDAYRDFLLDSKFDIVMCYAAQVFTADICFEMADRIKGKKVNVPCGLSGLTNPVYDQYFSKLPEVLKKYDKLIFFSNNYQDIKYAKKNGLKNIVVIPNGADEHEFQSLDVPDSNRNILLKRLKLSSKSKLILHVGSFTGLKGQLYAIELFKKAGIDNSTLVLVGNVFDAGEYRRALLKMRNFNFNPVNRLHGRKIVIANNLTRSETVNLYKLANLFLFTSMIEASPIVLFEAAAAGLPFLTTEVGNAEEICAWTQGGKLLPGHREDGYTYVNIAKGADLLRETLVDQRALKRMAEKGRHAWEKRFTWDKITDQYIKVYEEALRK